jgi:hypothetical protein
MVLLLSPPSFQYCTKLLSSSLLAAFFGPAALRETSSAQDTARERLQKSRAEPDSSVVAPPTPSRPTEQRELDGMSFVGCDGFIHSFFTSQFISPSHSFLLLKQQHNRFAWRRRRRRPASPHQRMMMAATTHTGNHHHRAPPPDCLDRAFARAKKRVHVRPIDDGRCGDGGEIVSLSGLGNVFGVRLVLQFPGVDPRVVIGVGDSIIVIIFQQRCLCVRTLAFIWKYSPGRIQLRDHDRAAEEQSDGVNVWRRPTRAFRRAICWPRATASPRCTCSR